MLPARKVLCTCFQKLWLPCSLVYFLFYCKIGNTLMPSFSNSSFNALMIIFITVDGINFIAAMTCGFFPDHKRIIIMLMSAIRITPFGSGSIHNMDHDFWYARYDVKLKSKSSTLGGSLNRRNNSAMTKPLAPSVNNTKIWL